MKRMFKWIAIVMALVVVALLVSFCFAQPLIPSRAYSVTATLNGTPIQAQLLRPPAIPGTFYVHLPDAQPRRYSWFGVAFSRQSVFTPVRLYSAWQGLLYIHTDQAGGAVLGEKGGRDWSVSFTASGVQFSNGALSVSLSR